MLNPNARLDSFLIGDFRFVVVDDVFVDPDAVRALVLDGGLTLRRMDVAVGYELVPDVREFTARMPGVLQGISGIVGTTIGEDIRRQFSLGPAFTKLRITKGPLFNCVYKLPFHTPHVDPCHVSSFVYLNPPDQCRGGTAVYRHVPSQRMNAVQDQPDIRWMESRPLDAPLSYSAGEWELLHQFEMKYNRLVIFNGSVIHKIFMAPEDAPWGESLQDTRLTLNNFFDFCQ